MRSKLTIAVLVLTVCLGHVATPARAAVVVLANRSEAEVRFTISSAAGPARTCTLALHDVLTIPLKRDLEIGFSVGGTRHRCRVRGNELYCFVGAAATMRLRQVGFRGTWSQPEQVGDKEDAKGRPGARMTTSLSPCPSRFSSIRRNRPCKTSGRSDCGGVSRKHRTF